MGQVARAAGDAELYERSVRLHSPQPNILQALEIAKQYVRFGPVDKAVPWLTGAAGSGRDVDRLDLLAEAYEKLGDRSRLLEVRRQLWENTLSPEAFREYIALLPPSQREEARRHAVERASHSDDVVTGTSLLLSLGEAASAEALARRMRDRLIDAYYTHLVDLAKQFEAAECALGAVLCLRALTDQILAAGRTKTYRYAKRYVDRLAALDGRVSDYREVPDHRGYLEHLRERHGRKRSFWKLVESCWSGRARSAPSKPLASRALGRTVSGWRVLCAATPCGSSKSIIATGVSGGTMGRATRSTRRWRRGRCSPGSRPPSRRRRCCNTNR